MLLVICVDRDDDLGRKAGVDTPVVGRESVEHVAREFGLSDPEDSDLNALYEAMRIYDQEAATGEDVEIAVLAGSARTHRNSERAVARQLDRVLDDVDATRALVVTDGAEDESVIPVVESRLKIDGVSRTVVRQAENLENAYHVMKQFLDDPETRATLLVPLGILLMIFPVDVVLRHMGFEGVAIALAAGVLGVYFIFKGFGLDDELDALIEGSREAIYSGKFSLITYIIAAGLAVIGVAGGISGVQSLGADGEEVVTDIVPLAMAFVQGSIFWLTGAGVVSSVGRIVDDYLRRNHLPRAYLNAPFYIVSLGLVFHGVSGYFLNIEGFDEVYLTVTVVVSVGIGATSTYVFGGPRRGGEGDEEVGVEIPQGES